MSHPKAIPTLHAIAAGLIGATIALLLAALTGLLLIVLGLPTDAPMRGHQIITAVERCERRRSEVRFQHDARGRPVAAWCAA